MMTADGVRHLGPRRARLRRARRLQQRRRIAELPRRQRGRLRSQPAPRLLRARLHRRRRVLVPDGAGVDLEPDRRGRRVRARLRRRGRLPGRAPLPELPRLGRLPGLRGVRRGVRLGAVTEADRMAPLEIDPYRLSPSAVVEPPRTLLETLRRTGPGMILAAAIVGSGELIATTTLGAQEGF